jgi:diguanylate cyclase (GGDEF)-like protein
MKDKHSVILMSAFVFILAAISGIQIYGITIIKQNNNLFLLSQIMNCFILTLVGATIGISVFLAREKIAIETKRKAYIDVTGIQNKRACMEKIRYLEEQDDTLDVGLAIFDLNNLKIINDHNGHDKGDELIKNFAHLLQDAVKRGGFVGRFGGDEFLVIAEKCSYQQMNKWIEILDRMVDEYNRRNVIQLCYAGGFEISNREHYYMMEDLLKEADKKMYENKRKYKIDKLLSTTKENEVDTNKQEVQNCKDCWIKEEECELEKEYNKMLHRDQLTGLLTYESFFEKVEVISAQLSPERSIAVFYSDISDFRYINDNYGYQVGNQVLRLFGDKLSMWKGTLSTARIFSDNFASVVDVTGLQEGEVIENLQRLNSEIAKEIQKKYRRNYFVIKTGIYFMKAGNEKAADVMNYCNTARKVAKESYQHVQIYSKELEEMEKSRADNLNSFHKAIEEEEFHVYFQPKMSGKDGVISGAEALVRWITKDGRVKNPDDFIPLFEQTGDVVEMDYYVYNKVFQWLRDRICSGKKVIPISLNVSQIHLKQHQEFIEYIKGIKMKYNIPAEYITFEITESAYIENVSIAKLVMEQLHVMGFKISMDDFGSGYSSLNSLQNLFFDEIKMDKEFLANGMTREGKVILQQLIILIKKLDKKVVCEGVENQEEVGFLITEQCDELQGYFFSKPLPIHAFEALL